MQYVSTLHTEILLSLSGTLHLHSFCCCQHFNHTSKPPNDFGSWRNAKTPQLEHLRWLLIEFIIADLAGHSSVETYFQWQSPGLQCRRWLWWKCLLQYLWTIMSKKTLSPGELALHRLPAAFKFCHKAFEPFCFDSWMWPSFLQASWV